jgi:tetratricopeptide (TPR) repeat protein
MEKDFARKADLCEKFIAAFKDSDFADYGYNLIVQSYLQMKNWQKAMDTADKAVAAFPNDDSFKKSTYLTAIFAAQSANDPDKAIAYADKLLGIDPNDLDGMITIATEIPRKSSPDKGQLNRAADMANRALAGLQPLLSKATPQQKPQLVQKDEELHQTLGAIAYSQKDYTQSIREYQKAIEDNKKNDAAHLYLAYNYINQMAQASQEFQAALKAENDAKQAKADQPTVDDLAAKRTELQDKVLKFRDMVIDELAKAAAVNGPNVAQAKDQLLKQWKAKNDDKTDGMDEYINSKKAEVQ